MIVLRWLALGLLLLAPGLARAQVPVKVGSFPGYGRIVFEFARPTGFEVAEADGRAQVTFAGTPALGRTKGLPRNVRAIEGGAGSATLVLAPGARVRSTRQGSRVVIDVLDPVPGQPTRAAQTVHTPAPAAPTAAAILAKAEDAPPPPPPPPRSRPRRHPPPALPRSWFPLIPASAPPPSAGRRTA